MALDKGVVHDFYLLCGEFQSLYNKEPPADCREDAVSRIRPRRQMENAALYRENPAGDGIRSRSK